jgi:hypothetical protein
MRKIFSLIVFTALCGHLFSQLACDQSLWAHVYNPERLQGDKKCTTVKGVVRSVKPEPDGSYTVQFKLDAGQPLALLNDKNMTLQNGCMVLVIICAHRPIAQPDALKSCGTYENRVKVPNVGEHLQVTGSYVTDADPAHGWNEIQPVSGLVELQKR